MADTDNTRTTRRAILTGIAATTAATALAVPATADAMSDVDAVLAAWRVWRPLEEEDWSINAAWQGIYSRHPSTRNIPSVLVFDVQCMSDDGIDEVCRRQPAWMQPAMPQLRESAKQELAAEIARSDSFDEKVGLAKLQRRSEDIDQIMGPLLDLIENADGSAPIIIAAKLDCALSHLRGDDCLSDCGPSGIASAIRGLLPELPEDMRQKLAPIAAGEGKIREIYTRPVADTVERRAEA
jgi:hypothetical protein